MLRKTILALAAIGAVAGAGLPSANAMSVKKIGPPVMKPHDDDRHHRHHRDFFESSFVFTPFVAGSYEGCLRKVWVKTPHGLRRRWVDVCAY